MFKFPQDRDGNPFNVSKQENVGKGKISMQIKFPNPSTIVKWVIFNGLYHTTCMENDFPDNFTLMREKKTSEKVMPEEECLCLF